MLHYIHNITCIILLQGFYESKNGFLQCMLTEVKLLLLLIRLQLLKVTNNEFSSSGYLRKLRPVQDRVSSHHAVFLSLPSITHVQYPHLICHPFTVHKCGLFSRNRMPRIVYTILHRICEIAIFAGLSYKGICESKNTYLQCMLTKGKVCCMAFKALLC